MIEIEKAEGDEENGEKIGRIIESFFASVFEKIMDTNLQLNKQISVDCIDGLSGPQYFYVNELADFFDIQTESTHFVPE